jgi:uncharacterized protein related to proFAR isomerase
MSPFSLPIFGYTNGWSEDMSGGSHNYLCSKDAQDMFDYQATQDLETMASRLIELGYVDAAKETLNLKYIVDQTIVRIEVHQKRLKGVWKSVEWHDSADSGLNQVAEAVEVYRTK